MVISIASNSNNIICVKSTNRSSFTISVGICLFIRPQSSPIITQGITLDCEEKKRKKIFAEQVE